MIDFIDVSKQYRIKGITKVILRDLTLRLPDDRNIGILGHNGAGKSTLMRLMSGAEHPSAGRLVRHTNISFPLGFSGGFSGQMTGVENTRFIARMYGADTEEVIDFVEEFSELGPSFRLPIATYSSGMKARLSFGVSMAINFGCYLIDELTAVGDERFKRKCNQIFEERLVDSRIIMVSHSRETIRRFCASGCVLHHGEMIYYDDVEEAIEVHDYNQRH